MDAGYASPGSLIELRTPVVLHMPSKAWEEQSKLLVAEAYADDADLPDMK